MPKKKDLLEKLCRKPMPRNFTKQELDVLMGKCECTKSQGGRGSGIRYYHEKTKQVLQFDEPHPGNELYLYHIKETVRFLKSIGEID